MKTTNALMAAALAGVFAAGTTHASPMKSFGAPAAEEKEKDKCDGKDGCKGKDKEKKEEEKLSASSTLSVANEADKDKCSGKDGCKGKDKDKDKEKKEGEIL